MLPGHPLRYHCVERFKQRYMKMDKNLKTGVPGNVFKLTVNGLVVE
jgi:hypothetical protein